MSSGLYSLFVLSEEIKNFFRRLFSLDKNMLVKISASQKVRTKHKENDLPLGGLNDLLRSPPTPAIL